jgi:MFS family permease
MMSRWTDGSPVAETSAAEVEKATVRTATIAVYAVFFLSGFNFANWASRLPLVRDLLGFDASQMGRIVLVAAIGSILALPLAGWIVQRIGARMVIAVFATVNVVAIIVVAWGVTQGSLVMTIGGLFLSGIGIGVWDAAMNLEGAATEQRLGKSIMPRFHAAFSFGTVAGAGVGALASWLSLSLFTHLTGALVISLALVLLATRRMLPHVGTGPEAPDPGDLPGGVGQIDHVPFDAADPASAAVVRPKNNPFAAWLERRTLLIGLVVLAAALTEGAANDWLGLAVVDGFDADHTTGAVALIVFLVSMTGMRLLGTALLDKHGRVFVLRLSAGLALAGLFLFGLAPWLPSALVGTFLWGMGAALGFPVGMSAASDDPVKAAGRVSVVSTIGYTAFFAGPPILGELAQHVGYRNALLSITIPLVCGLLVASVAASPAERAKAASA